MDQMTTGIRRVELKAAALDRAAGVLLASAVGDALGVPYEFAPHFTGEPQMTGGGLGPYAPGEHSDDTQMAVCIAEVAATGADLTDSAVLDAIADRFIAWYRDGATDVGTTTSAALRGVEPGPGSGSRLAESAARVFDRTRLGGGNGGLMRTGIVALTALGDREHTARAARVVCELTHADPFAGDCCVLWCEAIRVAVGQGRFDLAGGLDLIPKERRAQWATMIEDATCADPASIGPNGSAVTALQAAWAAITSTLEAPREFECDHLRDGLFAAVHAGHDADTVAAIAGALLGARWGASAVPAQYRRLVHGWPDLDAADLVRLSVTTVRGGEADEHGWPTAEEHDYRGWSPPMTVEHPMDAGVMLGTINTPNHGCDAVVSLCRRGRRRAAWVEREDQVDVWLIDKDDPGKNPNLAFVLADTARVIKQLRGEGKTVFVHCVAAQQRTPTIAVAYARLLGATSDEARASVKAALPSTRGRGHLWDSA